MKFILFADDTTIMYTHKNIDELNNILTNEIINVLNWFAANKLLLNLSKTHTMLFSNKRGNPKLKLNIHNVNLEEKKSDNILRCRNRQQVTLDKSYQTYLQLNQHINWNFTSIKAFIS